jgi:hypothetical protein
VIVVTPLEYVEQEELDQILKKATTRAREESKAAGTSFSYMINGKLIREYPDGIKFEVVRDAQGNRGEIEYRE